MILPLILSVGSIVCTNQAVKAHDTIPSCRYRELGELTKKANIFSELAMGLALSTALCAPVGLTFTLVSLGYLAYKHLC